MRDAQDAIPCACELPLAGGIERNPAGVIAAIHLNDKLGFGRAEIDYKGADNDLAPELSSAAQSACAGADVF